MGGVIEGRFRGLGARMTELIKIALIGSTAAILVSLILYGYLDPVNDQGPGVLLVNRFTGSVRYCDVDTCYFVPQESPPKPAVKFD